MFDHGSICRPKSQHIENFSSHQNGPSKMMTGHGLTTGGKAFDHAML